MVLQLEDIREMGDVTRTDEAFAEYRNAWSPARDANPDAAFYDGCTDPLSADDGMNVWGDGPVASNWSAKPAEAPNVDEALIAGRHLWVVGEQEVVHAAEKCAFGECREAGVIKHSNLTGGGKAYSGGEVIFLGDETIVINGSSGRYRPRGEAEMSALASAFRNSGYNVWTMGYDTDTDRPNMFETAEPEWVDL